MGFKIEETESQGTRRDCPEGRGKHDVELIADEPSDNRERVEDN